MSSEAPAQTGAAPAAAPAAAGGSSMMMIIAVVVVVIVVVAAAGYFLVLKNGDELSGKWTVSGGTMKTTMTVNDGEPIVTTENIPASDDVIDFDDETTMPEGMIFKDLGGGEFEIENFGGDEVDFGTVKGTYDIDGDTMTIKMSGSGSFTEGSDTVKIEFEYTMTLVKAEGDDTTDDDEPVYGLTGNWTLSGGEMKTVMVINNDTANTTWNNMTIPADDEIVNFDDESSMPEGMTFTDLGDGAFEITDYEMMGADFGTITGTYEVDGDTLTITMIGSGTYVDGGDYFEIDFDYTMDMTAEA